MKRLRGMVLEDSVDYTLGRKKRSYLLITNCVQNTELNQSSQQPFYNHFHFRE